MMFRFYLFASEESTNSLGSEIRGLGGDCLLGGISDNGTNGLDDGLASAGDGLLDLAEKTENSSLSLDLLDLGFADLDLLKHITLQQCGDGNLEGDLLILDVWGVDGGLTGGDALESIVLKLAIGSSEGINQNIDFVEGFGLRLGDLSNGQINHRLQNLD